MKDVDTICSGALYVKGDQLDPDLVTKVLGTSPTTARLKGAKQYSKEGVERPYTQPTGIWALELKEKASVSDSIAELSLLMNHRSADIDQIEGTEECYIDLFLCVSIKSRDKETYSFELSERDIDLLHGLKLPVLCTVTFIRDKETDA